jgi:periplasmic protein TonB
MKTPAVPTPTTLSLPILGAMSIASLFLHGALYAAVRPDRVSRPVVERFEISITKSEPKPPPPPEEKAEPPPPAPKPTRVARAPRPPPPPHTAPPEVPPPAGPPPPVHIGISLASTASSGSFAVGVGNSLYGKADTKAADPNAVKAYAGPARFVPPTRVSTLPRVLAQPKPEYTAEARKAEIEGQVVLLLTIDETGRVVAVKRLTGLGFGLDEAAERAAHELHFAPATLDGESVRTELRFTYTFLLE